jgi:hypothetical protein
LGMLDFLTDFRIKKNDEKDKTDIETLKAFLHSESLLTDKETRLDQVIDGMFKTVHIIIDETTTIYGADINIKEKIAELKNMNVNIPSEGLDDDSGESLKILAQANEVLKVLVQDHKYTANKELEFYKDDLFEEDLENIGQSYKKYVHVLKNIHDMSNVEKMVKKRKYYPIVESIIKHINEGKTHLEKRDIILHNLAKTFGNIISKYKTKRDKYEKVLKKYILAHEVADDISKKVIIRIIGDLNDIEAAIKKQLDHMELELLKINQVITLEDDLKKLIDEESILMKHRSAIGK